MNGQAPELTPVELITRIEAGEDIHVLDVRAPERLGRRGQIVLACLAPLPLVVAWAAALTG